MGRSEKHRAASLEQKGLPSRPDVEQLVLGAAMVSNESAATVVAELRPDDFSISRTRRIFERMRDLADRGVEIDRVTVAHELLRNNELDSVGGMSYLVSLDDGMPHIVNLDDYIAILREQTVLRKTLYGAQKLTTAALTGAEMKDLQAAASEILMALGEAEPASGPQSVGQIIRELPGGLNEFLGPRKQGLLTGYFKLDEMTGGFHPGDLIILAARPGVGKTALALNIASHVALKLGKAPLVFSLEMGKIELLHRLVCAEARVDNRKVRANYLSADERNKLRVATHALHESALLIDDQSAVTPAGVLARIRRRLAHAAVDLVVVDYLQLMSAGRTYESKNQEVTAITRSLKLIAREMCVPMLVLSQLSRAPELRKGNHRPQLSDLRDSGAIEQDADLVGFIFREEMYKPDQGDLRGKAELILAKHRNGPTGVINLVFLHNIMKFENRAEDIEPPPPMLKHSTGSTTSTQRIGKDAANPNAD